MPVLRFLLLGIGWSLAPVFADEVWSLSEPVTKADAGAFNTLVLDVPRELRWDPRLVLRGRLRVDAESKTLYAAINVLSKGGKAGFLRLVDAPASGTHDFRVPLRSLVVTKDSKVQGAWSGTDSLDRLSAYLKLAAPGASTFTLEELILETVDSDAEIPADKPTLTPTRKALFEGAFSLQPAWKGVHPRLFLDAQTLAKRRAERKEAPERYAGLVPGKASRLGFPKPIALDEKENASQTMSLAYLALLWRLESDEERAKGEDSTARKALLAWRPFLEKVRPIQVDPSSPTRGNKDLSTGQFLLGMALAYDLVHGRVPAEEEALYRRLLVDQARAAFAVFTSFKSYRYEQNHLIIPICGLGLAAMALVDELPEAKEWGDFSRNLLGRSLSALAPDGWFFEGLNYWSFTMEFPLVWAVALRRCVGEDLLKDGPFRFLPEYVAHQFLPGQEYAFDFADWGPRVNVDGTAQSGFETPWHALPSRIHRALLALVQQDRPHPLLASFFAAYAPRIGSYSSREAAFLLMAGAAPPAEAKRMEEPTGFPPFHHFTDMDVLHWRSSWSDPDATAIAFKCGPPAGHAIASLYPLYPEWKPGLGHAHPDAGSFLLWSKGGFLAGDTGYARKSTALHNTLTIDGRGQAKEESVWGLWDGMDYARLNRIRMEDAWLDAPVAAGTAVLDHAYPEELGIRELRRRLVLVEGRYLVVADRGEAMEPRTWQWHLHGDKVPEAAGEDGWTFESGGARMIVRNLEPGATSKTEATVVDAHIYDGPPRLQTRGGRLQLDRPASKSLRSLVAMVVQGKGEAIESVRVERTGPTSVAFTDGSKRCEILVGPSEAVDGAFAYTISEGGAFTTVAAFGGSFRSAAGLLDPGAKKGAVVRKTADGWVGSGRFVPSPASPAR